jgi:DNA-binding transcriptional LysR family regulator
MLYPAGSRTRAVIDAGLATLGIRPRVALESHNPEVLRQMVALGLGWTVLPLPVAEERAAARAPALRQGALVAERSLVGVRRQAENPRVEAFLALARERHDSPG